MRNNVPTSSIERPRCGTVPRTAIVAGILSILAGTPCCVMGARMMVYGWRFGQEAVGENAAAQAITLFGGIGFVILSNGIPSLVVGICAIWAKPEFLMACAIVNALLAFMMAVFMAPFGGMFYSEILLVLLPALASIFSFVAFTHVRAELHVEIDEPRGGSAA